LKYLRDNQIVCDVALTSNLLLGVTADIELHQLPKLLEAGVPVTINTDDQAFFGAMMCDEFKLVRDTFGLSDYELAGMARVSALASGAPEATKQRILRGIDEWLESEPDEDVEQ
jgi:adenosine deaminase